MWPYSFIMARVYVEKVTGTFYKLTKGELIRYIPTEELDYAIKNPSTETIDYKIKNSNIIEGGLFKIKFKDGKVETIHIGEPQLLKYALEYGYDDDWNFEGVVTGIFYKLTPTPTSGKVGVDNFEYLRDKRVAYVFIDDLTKTNSKLETGNSVNRELFEEDREKLLKSLQIVKNIPPTPFISEYLELKRKAPVSKAAVNKAAADDSRARARVENTRAKAMEEKKELNNAIYGSHNKSTSFAESLGIVGGPGYGGGKRKSKKNKTRKSKTRKH
jgi:hypothetical protein